MTDTPNEGPDGRHERRYSDYLKGIASDAEVAARVKRGEEWIPVNDQNVDDVIAELDGPGPIDITDLIIYEKYRVVARQDSAELLGESRRQVTDQLDDLENELCGEVGVEVYQVEEDAFDLVNRLTSADDRQRDPSSFEPGSSVEAMTPIALLHGFLVQGHSFFFNDQFAIVDDPATSNFVDPLTEPVQPVIQAGGRTIGIIDTGADKAHPWLGGISADQEQNGSVHGTIVTGIVQQGDPGAKVIVRRPDFMTNAILRELSIVAKLYGLVKKEQCDVVNCSFGASTFGKIPLFRFVISWLRLNASFDVVAAAGNRHGNHVRTPIYPAAWKEVLAVAAGDGGDGRTNQSPYYDWSNGGPWVDHIVEIRERPQDRWLVSSAPTLATKARFAFVRGTSVVAPLVAALPDPTNLGSGKNAHVDNRV